MLPPPSMIPGYRTVLELQYLPSAVPSVFKMLVIQVLRQRLVGIHLRVSRPGFFSLNRRSTMSLGRRRRRRKEGGGGGGRGRERGYGSRSQTSSLQLNISAPVSNVSCSKAHFFSPSLFLQTVLSCLALPCLVLSDVT